jgi:hypothetical protein
MVGFAGELNRQKNEKSGIYNFGDFLHELCEQN